MNLNIHIPALSQSLEHSVLKVQMFYTASSNAMLTTGQQSMERQMNTKPQGQMAAAAYSNIEYTNGSTGASAALVKAELLATWASSDLALTPQ